MSDATFRHVLAPDLAGLVSSADDLRHRAPPGERMRDSLFWQVSMPDEKLCMQAYFFCTGSGKAGYNMCLWGEGLDSPIMHFHGGEVADDNDFSDFTFGALSIQQQPAAGRSRVRYDKDGFGLDLQFDALHDAFSYFANEDGLPDWFAANRVEQSGRLAGFVRIGDRRVSLDGRVGHRDHSWGLRDWRMPHHWKWLTAYTPDGETTLNAWIWYARGEHGIAGYVARGGTVHPIRAIREKTRYDADMIQQALSMQIDYGQVAPLDLHMQTFAAMQFPSTDKNPSVITEAGCAATIDGIPAAGQYETQWQASYYRYLKN